MIKEHQKVINQINKKDNDNRADNINERKSNSDQTEKNETPKFKLCRECMDGNSEVKTHYIKEHYEVMKRKIDIQCEYSYCIKVLGDKFPEFCFFYQKLITF